MPFTHRSTLTGTKDTGSGALVAFVGQPAQANPLTATDPPPTGGTTGVGPDGAATTVACPGAPLLASPLLAGALLAFPPLAAGPL